MEGEGEVYNDGATQDMRDKWIKYFDATHNVDYYYNTVDGSTTCETASNLLEKTYCYNIDDVPPDYYPGGQDPSQTYNAAIEAPAAVEEKESKEEEQPVTVTSTAVHISRPHPERTNPWTRGYDPRPNKRCYYYCNAKTEQSVYHERPVECQEGKEAPFPRFHAAFRVQRLARMYFARRKVKRKREEKEMGERKTDEKLQQQLSGFDEKKEQWTQMEEKFAYLKSLTELKDMRTCQEALKLVDEELAIVRNRFAKFQKRLKEKISEAEAIDLINEASNVLKPLATKLSVAIRHAQLHDVSMFDDAWKTLIAVSSHKYISAIEPKYVAIANIKGFRATFEITCAEMEKLLGTKSLKFDKELVFENLIMGRDYFEFHKDIMGCVDLVRRVDNQLKYAIKAVNQAQDEQRQEMERYHMRQEDSVSSKVRHAMKSRGEEQDAREVFISACYNAWKDGLHYRLADKQKRDKENEKRLREVQLEKQARQYKAQLEKDSRYLNKTPWEACKGGVSIECLQDLIKAEADRRKFQNGIIFHIDDYDFETKETLLRNAVWFGHRHLVQYLIDRGGNVNAVDSQVNKISLLHEAAKCGFPNIITLLVGHGADMTAKDSSGDTPLHVAARGGIIDVIAALLRFEKEKPQQTWKMVNARNGKKKLASEVATKKIAISFLKDFEDRGKHKLALYGNTTTA